jgi:hypothetical protein
MDKPSRFCRLKDNLITPALRQLDSNFASIVYRAAVVVWWL